MTETTQLPTYRPDIDGLRAVAVLAVVFYHLKLKVWGGFVGVDVFFVISGFLISSVILKQIARSTFSLADFYKRRVRRIIPALIVMMGITIIGACMFLLPFELETFARSLIAAGLSVSNLFFWLHSGYFDPSAADQPLLHTWSLGVEEQFYIFFPLFLVAIRRYFPNRFKSAIVALACASFALSAFGAYWFMTATFYLPFTRAWELLLGTVLSLELFPRVSSGLWRNIMSISGLLMIIVTALTYETSIPFPGIAAVPPCLGAALIIAAGQGGPSFVGKFLSLRPVVFIGLISYSFYLWHWPIIVIQRARMIQVPGAAERNVKLAILGFSFVAAVLSWKFIETPFRKGTLIITNRAAFTFAAATSIGLCLVGAVIVARHGFPARYSPEEVQIASYSRVDVFVPYRIGTCYINTNSDFDKQNCMHEDPSKENILLFGDSHAAQLWYGLNKVLPNVNIMEAASSGCEPTLTHSIFDTKRCVGIMNFVFYDFLPKNHVDEVLLAARWEAGDVQKLGATIEHFRQQGVHVILFGPIMQYDAPLPRLLAVSLREGNSLMPARHELQKYRTLDQQLATLSATTWHVRYVSYFKLLCPESRCQVYADKDIPLQFDYGHLTKEGSVMVAQAVKDRGFLSYEPTVAATEPLRERP